MFESLRFKLSTEVISWGIALCPDEEVRDYLKAGLMTGLEAYIKDGEGEDDD